MLRRTVAVAGWLVTLVAVAVLAACVLVPRVAGAEPYTVLTGSMRPDMPPGTLVVVRPVAFEDIGIGDVVTYQLESGERAVVTHRVVGKGVDGRGRPVLVTQGDANEDPDSLPVREVQVRGEVWYHVPWLGRLNVLFTADQHVLMVKVAAGGFFLYALLIVARGWRDRRRPEPVTSPGRRRHVRS